MQAIIVTGGKQYNVAEGDTLFIEKLNAEAGEDVVFDQVLPRPGSNPSLLHCRQIIYSRMK